MVGRNFALYLVVREKLSNNYLLYITLPGVGNDVVVAFRAILSLYPNLLNQVRVNVEVEVTLLMTFLWNCGVI